MHSSCFGITLRKTAVTPLVTILVHAQGQHRNQMTMLQKKLPICTQANLWRPPQSKLQVVKQLTQLSGKDTLSVFVLLDIKTTSESVQTTPMETTTGDDPSIVIKDCLDVFNAGNTTNGIYTIKPTNWTGDSFDVFCNMTDGGGWTVFQRRVDGSVDFYRNWISYKEGFGDPGHEFWLGNDKLSHLTNQGDYEIRIDMVNKYGNPYYAKYDLFRINDESDNYRLSELGAYNGTADTNYKLDLQGLEYHRNQAFSTYDRDNDNHRAGNCAVTYQGAWWYKNCHRSNLNGDYHAVDVNPDEGKRGVSITWLYLPGYDHNIKYTEMKIRPV